MKLINFQKIWSNCGTFEVNKVGTQFGAKGFDEPDLVHEEGELDED